MMRTLCYVFPLATVGAALCPSDGVAAEVTLGGEAGQRLHMLVDRFLNGDPPRFMRDFILADIELRPDYPRRFNEYSGDLSGRVIEALACMPELRHEYNFMSLAPAALACQRPDGRFGDAALRFTPEEIKLEHMALLWGNGRLLVGLLTWRDAERWPEDAEILQAARRLGDFLLTVHDACANEQVAVKVKDLGAAGMICFSQLIEGFVMLSLATLDPKYLDAAERIVPFFPKERGTQHSHGYLTTLRGILMLHEATRRPEYLAMVESLYDDLVKSSDYTIYGGVQEYFGGKGDRDEGCSEADFVRLSLQLWRVTGRAEYIERAERCLFNQFYANQFSTGDFGHHLYFNRGVAPCVGVGRAWWCCTMHAVHALKDAGDMMIDIKGNTYRVNLFLEGTWSVSDLSVSLKPWSVIGTMQGLQITINEIRKKDTRIAVRRPGWLDLDVVKVNDAAVTPVEKDGYWLLDRELQKNDCIQFIFHLRQRIVKRDGTTLTLDQLGDTPVEGALFCGPWLMGVDEADAPSFFGEPWTGNQVMPEVPDLPPSAQDKHGPITDAHPIIGCWYVHEGFPSLGGLALRPIAGRTTHEPATFAIWLNYRRASR